MRPTPHGGDYPAKLKATGLALVRTASESQPEATLQELYDGFRATARVTVSPVTMRRGLAKPRPRLSFRERNAVSTCLLASRATLLAGRGDLARG